VGVEVDDAVAGGPLAGEDACPAACAYRGCDKGVGEADAVCSEVVDVGGLDNGIAGAAQCVGAMVVGEEEDDVGAFRGLGGFGKAGAACGERYG